MGGIVEGIANTKANMDLHILIISAMIISQMVNVRLPDVRTDIIKSVHGKGAYIFTILINNQIM